MQISASGRSDRGCLRPHNEDSFLVAPEHGLFVVADGMGGHAAGEVASKIAVEAVLEVMSAGPAQGESIPDQLRRAVTRSNENIAARIRERPDYRGMGTTLVVLCVRESNYWVAHVGDSRAYLVRGEAIKQLTTDHSFVNELVRLGMLSREQAARDPRRNVVTRALGSGSAVAPDIQDGVLESGDVLLLCSDGLNTMVEDERILQIVREGVSDLDEAAGALVDAANESGGEDNVTVVLAGAGASAAASAEPESCAGDEAD